MPDTPSIGPYQLSGPAILAPMAGVTDRPFRQLCRSYGAALTVGEMVSVNPDLRNTRKSQLRLDHHGEPAPVAVQILGGDPETLAEGARYNAANGADIIDINMGCPAKKVCKKAAGSALMQDEGLVREILHAVVDAVDIPVTLKMRTGWDTKHKNAPVIATMAEQAGICSLAVHGRTRACGYGNTVEYDTIRDVKHSVSIPVFANGDITSATKAIEVMEITGADGILIGRAAQGQPWIFREINHLFTTGYEAAPASDTERGHTLLQHLQAIHQFYGELPGVRIARKHLAWYTRAMPGAEALRQEFNRLPTSVEQIHAVRTFFQQRVDTEEFAA